MANRVLLGDRGDGIVGLWVSRPGVDVYTANQFDLILDSLRPIISYVESGTVSLTTGTWASIAITNLGYPPHVVAFITSSGIYDHQGSLQWRISNNSTAQLLYTAASGGAANVTARYMIIGVPSA